MMQVNDTNDFIVNCEGDIPLIDFYTDQNCRNVKWKWQQKNLGWRSL